MIAHKRLPVAALAGVAGIPLAVAYAIGRIRCFLAGDGTYGVASDLPWAMSFPDGTVPTIERVHPTALYEAAGAFLIAALLWRLRGRIAPVRLFGLYVILSGLARALVEIVRRNDAVLGGLTQPQLWSLALVALGVVLLLRGDDLRSARPPRRPATGTAGTAG